MTESKGQDFKTYITSYWVNTLGALYTSCAPCQILPIVLEPFPPDFSISKHAGRKNDAALARTGDTWQGILGNDPLEVGQVERPT